MVIVRRVLTVFFLLGCAACVTYLVKTKPEPPEVKRERPTTLVEGARLSPVDYKVVIESQGTVLPRTESTLIPEVAGRVVSVSDSFRGGGFFSKGETLLTIDRSDYETALSAAEATLAQARLRLAEEEARAQQAQSDWKSLGYTEKPSDLVLRKPQLAEARAAIASAEARVEKARRDLERTVLKAPYEGRVLEKNVDVGQYVSPGSVLARIYATDYAEVRLPLTNTHLALVDLPEAYSNADGPVGGQPEVVLSAEYGRETYTWEGRVVRTEGSVDVRSRQLFVIAQVENPYARTQPGKPPLKVGMYVKALIEGKTLEDVFVLPREALRNGNEVLLVEGGDTLTRRRLDVLWSTRDEAIVRSGLESGDVLVLTPLAYAAEGAKVRVRLRGKEPNDAARPEARTAASNE